MQRPGMMQCEFVAHDPHAAAQRGRKRRSKHVPQRDDVFVKELRMFMKEFHYTQFDLSAALQCSQV